MKKFEIPKYLMGRPVDEWLKEDRKKSQPEKQAPLNPNLESKIDSWKISNVNYRNNTYVVDLAKELLPAKTQDAHAQHRKQAQPKGDFYVGDMSLYHSLFTALYNQKGNPQTEEIRAFIQKQMRATWLVTLTRIAYQPNGKDKIIHNYNTKDKYELQENIIGPDRAITNKDSSALKSILGSGDISQIKEVYNWINQTPSWIWRVNSSPNQIDERVARFLACSDWASLSCDRNPDGTVSALGVRLVAQGV